MDTPAPTQTCLEPSLLTAEVVNALFRAAAICTQSGLGVELTLKRVQPMSVMYTADYALHGQRHYLFVLLSESGAQARLVRIDAQGNDAMSLFDEVDNGFVSAIGQTLASTVCALYARLVPLGHPVTHLPPVTLQ